MRLLWAVVWVAFTTSLAGCTGGYSVGGGEDTHLGLVTELIDCWREFADILEDVDDASDAASAARDIEALAERVRGIAKRIDKLEGDPPEEEQKAVEALMRDEGFKHEKRIEENLKRLGRNREVVEALRDATRSLQDAMGTIGAARRERRREETQQLFDKMREQTREAREKAFEEAFGPEGPPGPHFGPQVGPEVGPRGPRGVPPTEFGPKGRPIERDRGRFTPPDLRARTRQLAGQYGADRVVTVTVHNLPPNRHAGVIESVRTSAGAESHTASGRGSMLTIVVAPVADVEALASRLSVGKVTSVDPDQRTITIDAAAGP